MKTSLFKGVKRYTIDPGEYFVSKEKIIISTLLGSCVSACLWDPVNKVIGMNHFLLANRRYVRDRSVIESEAGRYGINAMELLINEMLKCGAARANLRAKAFGGGNVLQNYSAGDSFFAIGDVNSRFILEFLDNEAIPLEMSDLGGRQGRVINFVADDFSVYMKRIEKAASAQQVIAAEHKHFDSELARHDMVEKTSSEQIQIW